MTDPRQWTGLEIRESCIMRHFELRIEGESSPRRLKALEARILVARVGQHNLSERSTSRLLDMIAVRLTGRPRRRPTAADLLEGLSLRIAKAGQRDLENIARILQDVRLCGDVGMARLACEIKRRRAFLANQQLSQIGDI